MDPTKTRIWNADQLGLSAHKRNDQSSPHAGPVRGNRSRSVPPPPPPPRRARASAPPPAPSTLTARWSAHADPRGPLASTRIMPIELLLPTGMPALPQPLAARAVPKRFRTLKRVAGHVLLAVLTVLAVALWKLPVIQYVRARSLPPRAAHVDPVNPARAPREGSGRQVTSEPPLGAAAHGRPEADEREQRTETAPSGASLRANRIAASRAEHGSVSGAAHAHEVGTVVSPAIAEVGARQRGRKGEVSVQRQAVELVIGGDFAGAEQAYRVLAREYLDQQAFHEAARILAERRRK